MKHISPDPANVQPIAKALRVLIVDDETEACRNLQNILSKYIDCNIQVAGIAHDTVEAERLVRLHNPDAIFLDIEMPEENAFDFLQRIYPYSFEVVFITAYDEYAIKAFKLHAMDYLLKPVIIEDLQATVDKLKETVLQKKIASEDKALYQKLLKEIFNKKSIHYIVVKDKGLTHVIDFSQIIFIEAMAGYSKITYMEGNRERSVISSHSISEYEDMLATEYFYRIHKSYLVNCTRIKSISKGDNPTVLVTGTLNLPVSRRRIAGLMNFFKGDTRGI